MKYVLSGVIASVALASSALADDVSVCLITKTDTNPFYVAMKIGAEQRAEELGVDLKAYAGRIDGDNESQVAAIETCILDGVDAIMLTPVDTRGIVATVEKAQEAGILVLALDTPLDPIDAADGTLATDNFAAGVAIGEWAFATMGDDAATARIGGLNALISQPSVGVLRNQGFLTGFGVGLEDPNKWGDETDPRISGNDVSFGSEEGGRTGMENLLQRDPEINMLYAINEPAAAGAYETLRSVGREDDVLIVAVDGGCPGVQNVKDGVIGATSQQYPLLMASRGIEVVVDWVNNGTLPPKTEGKDFFDTGVNLVTDHPVEGIESISTDEAAEICWG